MPKFEKALICINGHILTSCLSENRHLEPLNHCRKCGGGIVSRCSNCEVDILGCEYHEYESWATHNTDTYYHESSFELPAYCHNCSNPYPWTEAALKEISEIIALSDELDDVEKAILREMFPNDLIDGSSTVSSALRIAKILKPVADTIGEALKAAIASKVTDRALVFIGWN